MRFLIAFAAVVAIYMSPMYFSDMSFSYLAEAAIKSGFIIAVCDYCRKEYKELALIIAIEFFVCLVCVIIALRWQPGMVGIEIMLTDISNLSFAVELLILLTIGAMMIGRRTDCSIDYNRRRDDIRRNYDMESIA